MWGHEVFGRLGVLGSAVVCLALSGCSGAPALNLPGLQTSALNIPEKPALAEKEASPADTKAARSRLNEAATLAAARADPRDAEAVLAAARILRRQGDKAGALALLDSAASAAANDARLLRDRGLLALELGAVTRARDHLQRAIAGGSRDWQTHSALGAALAANGKPKEAERAFAEALKLAPDNPVVLNNLALALALDGRRGDAERVLRRAAAATPRESNARVSQNLSLVTRISTRDAKPAERPQPTQSNAPVVPGKDAKKAAAVPAAVKTAHAD